MNTTTYSKFQVLKCVNLFLVIAQLEIKPIYYIIYIMGPRTTPADKAKLVQMDSIFCEIQTIYDAGTPIFTKDNIRQVGEELRRFQNGERNDGGNITMRGVNGVDYEVFVHPPRCGPPRENEVPGGSTW